jgi:hypothetical protein
MLPGDTFEITRWDLEAIACPDCVGMRGNVPDRRKVKCIVNKIYLRSSYEVIYVCSTLTGRKEEFAICQFLEDAYEVKVTTYNPQVQLSKTVLVEAAARAKVRPFSDYLPNVFTKEDAEKVALEIKNMQLKEKHGWLST